MWERLGLELDRRAEQVYRRWWGGIEHVLTRHLAGKSSHLHTSLHKAPKARAFLTFRCVFMA